MQVVIRRMEEKAAAAGMHGLKWQVADMLDLPFEDSSFDVVLEKGTMDVLFVDNDSPWQPKPEVCGRVHQMLSQVHRSALDPRRKIMCVPCHGMSRDRAVMQVF